MVHNVVGDVLIMSVAGHDGLGFRLRLTLALVATTLLTGCPIIFLPLALCHCWGWLVEEMSSLLARHRSSVCIRPTIWEQNPG